MSAQLAFRSLQDLGLEQVLQAAWEKLRRQDGVHGSIKVTLSRAQREALEGLVRLPRTTSAAVTIALAKLDSALLSSKFRVGLIAVLEAGYGPLVTRRQAEENEAVRWTTWLADRFKCLPDAAAPWLQAIAGGETAGARWVRRNYRDDPVQTAQVVEAVGRALTQLPAETGSHQLLAVFAANLTGNPHFFDAGQPGGRLLLHALAERFPPPSEASDRETRTFLLDMASLGMDQVSSTVLVTGLGPVYTEEAEHPVLAAMSAYGGAWRITLGEIRRCRAVAGRFGRAFVVENPSVFEHLLGRLSIRPPEQRPTLVCTEGFLSAAAVHLLDLLAEGGTEIWYSGDFDQNGLAIAEWIRQQYPGSSRLWRMDQESYLLALGPHEGHVAYQERLVELLLADCLATG